MGLARHRWRWWTVRVALPAALLVVVPTALSAAEGTDIGGDFPKNPLKELYDVPGPALLGKDFVFVGHTRRDDDYVRDHFGLRRFVLSGTDWKEDVTFSDLANTPPYLPRGGRRLGNSFHDLAGKIDPASARSLRNYPNRVLAGPDGGWFLVGRVGGDEGKPIPALLKLKADGTVDADYGKSGRAVLPARHRTNGITAAAVVGPKEPRLWLGLPGPGGMGVARLDAKGSLDASFGDDGMLFTELAGYENVWPQKILAHEDGSATVVACAANRGKKHLVLARITAAGKLEAEKFGGDKGKGGWTPLEQTLCDTWMYAPRTGRPSAYYFAADAWAVNTGASAVTVAVDGQDPCRDRIDPIFGARALNWRKDTVGLLRLSADGTPDAAFGTNGVVVLDPPTGQKATVGALVTGKDGELWLAAVLKSKDGTALGWARVDGKGKRLPWSKTDGRSTAKTDGDWLVFPVERDRDITVRAVRFEDGKATAFGYAAGRDETDALRWKLWRVKN